MAQAAASASSGGTSLSIRGITAWIVVALPTFLLLWVAAVVAVVGLPYYLTDDPARPDHAMHPWFGAGGVVGLLVGFIGTGLMTIMLLYTVRKWLPFVSFMGSMQFWMRVHVICGLLGPLFIVLHGGVKLPSGFIGIGFWCMTLVALSGFFGRYLFGYFPQTAQGLRVDIKAAQQRLT